MSNKSVIFSAISGNGNTLANILVSDVYQIAITGRREDKWTAIKAKKKKSISRKDGVSLHLY